MFRGLHLNTRRLWIFNHRGLRRLGSAVYAEVSCLDKAGGDSVEAGNILVPHLDVLLLRDRRCLLVMLLESLRRQRIAVGFSSGRSFRVRRGSGNG